jgi:hypothetical protein
MAPNHMLCISRSILLNQGIKGSAYKSGGEGSNDPLAERPICRRGNKVGETETDAAFNQRHDLECGIYKHPAESITKT